MANPPQKWVLGCHCFIPSRAAQDPNNTDDTGVGHDGVLGCGLGGFKPTTNTGHEGVQGFSTRWGNIPPV